MSWNIKKNTTGPTNLPVNKFLLTEEEIFTRVGGLWYTPLYQPPPLSVRPCPRRNCSDLNGDEVRLKSKLENTKKQYFRYRCVYKKKKQKLRSAISLRRRVQKKKITILSPWHAQDLNEILKFNVSTRFAMFVQEEKNVLCLPPEKNRLIISRRVFVRFEGFSMIAKSWRNILKLDGFRVPLFCRDVGGQKIYLNSIFIKCLRTEDRIFLPHRSKRVVT